MCNKITKNQAKCCWSSGLLLPTFYRSEVILTFKSYNKKRYDKVFSASLHNNISQSKATFRCLVLLGLDRVVMHISYRQKGFTFVIGDCQNINRKFIKNLLNSA